MIQSIPMYGLLYFLFGCDGVVLVWILAPKRTVDRTAVVFTFISPVMFGGSSRLSSYRNTSVVNFRQ